MYYFIGTAFGTHHPVPSLENFPSSLILFRFLFILDHVPHSFLALFHIQLGSPGEGLVSHASTNVICLFTIPSQKGNQLAESVSSHGWYRGTTRSAKPQNGRLVRKDGLILGQADLPRRASKTRHSPTQPPEKPMETQKCIIPGWKLADIGFFYPDMHAICMGNSRSGRQGWYRSVHSFTDRLRVAAQTKDLVRSYRVLKKHFKRPPSQAMGQLGNITSGFRDAANRRSVIPTSPQSLPQQGRHYC